MSELQMDLLGGLTEKKKGMELAAMGRQEILAYCRDVAVFLCRRDGTTNSDEVRRYADLPPIGSNRQNWMGSIFKDRRFEPTGQVVNSTIKRNHGATIRIWKLRATDR